MTLRLRLTLLTTLLVAVILTVSGVGVRLLLSRSLRQGLDEGLLQAADLLAGFIETDADEEDGPSLRADSVIPQQIRAGLVAVLFDPEGRILDILGSPPDPPPLPASGFATHGGWRIWGQEIHGLTLMTMQPTDALEHSLLRFDRAFSILTPLAVLLACGLGYIVAGAALRPIDRLTRAAYDLAKRRAWRERLPVTAKQDELWRLAQATNTLLATLEEVIEAERRFTADAAHELRTPLTVLRGWLEKIVEDSTDPAIRRALGKATQASDALLVLVEKLLVLARTEVGQGLVSEPISLAEVALECSELLRPRFEQKGLDLSVELPANPAWVRGDRTALDMALRNLLENALRFTAHGAVGLALETVGDTTALIVEDSGPGIAEEALPHLFDRFYQGDVRHRREGSGLGLALVSTVAKWHGGEVRVENRSGGGARFTLMLPAAPRP